MADDITAALSAHPSRSRALVNTVDGGARTYAQLRAASDAVARRIGALVPPGRLVALCPSSAVEAVELVLGAIRAGRPFVPLNPSLSQASVDSVLRQTGADTFGSGPLGRRSGGADMSSGLRRCAGHAWLASSGVDTPPTIAVMGRDALRACIPGLARAYRLVPDDVVLQAAPFGHQDWLEQVLPALFHGGTVAVTRHGERIGAREMTPLVEDLRVTVAAMRPAFWAEWVGELGRSGVRSPPSLRQVVVGNDRIPAETALEWIGRHPGRPRLLTAYDSPGTATALIHDVTAYGVPAGETAVPLGTPLSYARVRVEPEGTGELLLGGPMVCEGCVENRTLARPAWFLDEGGVRWRRTGVHVMRTPRGVVLERRTPPAARGGIDNAAIPGLTPTQA